MRRLCMVSVLALVVLAACSSETVDERRHASPVNLNTGEVACSVDYGDDPELILGPVPSGEEQTLYTSDDTAVIVSAGQVVGVRVVGADGDVHGDFGLTDVTETGVTFSGEASPDSTISAYAVTCWRG